MPNIIEQIFDISDKTAQKLGFYLVDMEYVTENKDKILRMYIDKQGGITIDDCEAYSREVEQEIDRLDPINEAYCLEVSSPGVDRILKKEREFLYYLNREVDVKLYKAHNGIKEFSGILSDYKENVVYIKVLDEMIEIPVKEAVYIRLSFRI